MCKAFVNVVIDVSEALLFNETPFVQSRFLARAEQMAKLN